MPTTECRAASSDTPDVTILGAGAGDFLADRFSIATGDFNGDSFDDLALGAPLADGPDDSRHDAGEVYVVMGDQEIKGTLDLVDGAADLAIYGATPGGNMGFTLAAGDINRDGADDLAVGARFAGGDEAGDAKGEAYVIYGGLNLGGTVDIAEGEQDVTVVGADPGDYLSIAMAVGDTTGDGFSDLILGAAAADGPNNTRKEAGEVSVVLGSDALPSLIDLHETDPFFVMWGAQAGDLMPNRVTTGDLDGDGRAEVIAGAPLAGRDADGSPNGEVYILQVPNSAGSEEDIADGERHTVIRGAGAMDGFGFNAAAADVSGDGTDDVLIGARDADGANDERNNAGEIHVLLGESTHARTIELVEDRLDAVLIGSDPNDSLGFALATGDLNGDGVHDVLAGAPLGDGCADSDTDAGELHAVLGRKEWPEAIDIGTTEPDRSVYGGQAGDELGFSLAAADIDGDGNDDIVTGALLADGPDDSREDSGEVYVILSR